LALTAVSADEPGHKPLSRCKMVPLILTLYAGKEDHEYRVTQKQKAGITALRACKSAAKRALQLVLLRRCSPRSRAVGEPRSVGRQGEP